MLRGVALLAASLGITSPNYFGLTITKKDVNQTESAAVFKVKNGQFSQGSFSDPYQAGIATGISALTGGERPNFWLAIENGALVFDVRNGNVTYQLDSFHPEVNLVGMDVIGATSNHTGSLMVLGWLRPGEADGKLEVFEHLGRLRKRFTKRGDAAPELFIGEVLPMGVVSLVVGKLPDFYYGELVNGFQCELNAQGSPTCLYSGLTESGENKIVRVDLDSGKASVHNATGSVGGFGMPGQSDEYYYWSDSDANVPSLYRARNGTSALLAEVPGASCGIIQGNIPIQDNQIGLIVNSLVNGEAYCSQAILNFDLKIANYTLQPLPVSNGTAYQYGIESGDSVGISSP